MIIMTWDDIEKFMTANPDTVLSIYTLERETFLNDDPILLNGMRWDMDHGKFNQIPSGNIFGLSRFMIRTV